MMLNENFKNGWTKLKLSEICDEASERVNNPSESGYERFVGLEHMETGETRLRKYGSTSELVSAMKLFRAGDVLVARRNVYLQRAAKASFDGVCSGDAIVLRPKSESVKDLLEHILNTKAFWSYAIQHAAGTMSKRLSVEKLLNYEFSLPTTDRQIQISRLLNQQVELVESWSAGLLSLLNLKRSFAAHAFSKGLRKKSTAAKAVHHRTVPVNWETMSLGDVFDLLDNKRIPIKDSDRNKRKGEYPYYGASGPIDFIDDYLFDEPLLLLAEDGMNLLFRSSPLVYKVTERCWVNNHAHVLKPTTTADIDFYLEYLESISYEPFVTGTYQKKITKSDCLRIPIPVPPMDEQSEIAEAFTDINQQLVAISTRTDTAKRLLAESREAALGYCDVY